MADSARASFDSASEHDHLKDSHHAYKDDDHSASVSTSLLGNIFDSEKLTHRFPFHTRARASSGRSWRRPLLFSSPGRLVCLMICLAVVGIFMLVGAGGFVAVKVIGVPTDGQSDPWYPSPRGGTVREWTDAYRKAHDLVRQMTLVEKVNITTGTGWMMGPCVGNTGTVDRLSFPSLCLQDGPLGLRFADHATAFPAGVTVGATWNKTAMYWRGAAHGIEARGKGINVILGPSMGPLGRLPAGGRNWEGFGADPVLQGIASAQTIQGIQNQGVIATAKHFVGNEQEHYRQSWEWGTPNAISSNIDDRTMHEFYAWPFADSVRAGVGSVMCSYQQVNNSYACQNSKLINGILKDEFGFQGFVQSDWLAQRSGVASALAGLDMSMPGDGLRWQDGNSLWGAELTKSVLNGTVPVERLDDMVLRIVAAWYQMGQNDRDVWHYENGTIPNFSSWTNDEVGLVHPGSDDPTTAVVNKFVDVQSDHAKYARAVAEEGIVMVKNVENMLPLLRDGFTMTGMSDRKLRVGIFGEDAFDNPKGPNACSDRACNEYTLASGWGSGSVEFPYLISPAAAIKDGFKAGSVDFTEHRSNVLDRAGSDAASRSDICMVFVNSDAGEGYVSWKDVKGDRNDLKTQKGGDKLVKDVASKCGSGGHGPVIVVLHSVGPVIVEEWIENKNVKAVLLPHLPGQESGNALAAVLFGDVSPSGHLPYTIAKKESDYGPHSGILRSTKHLVPQQNFTERMYVDYRHFDQQDIEPRFEFGFGLSYTSFRVSDMTIYSLIAERKALPNARPRPEDVPSVDRRVPPASEATFPPGFNAWQKFVYPFIRDEREGDKSSEPYPYPAGYSVMQPPGAAGGAQGGNPDLYTPFATVKVSVENTGGVSGSVALQLYVSFPPNVTDASGAHVDFPVRQLRAFEKVRLDTVLNYETGEVSGERKDVMFELTRRDLSYWDTTLQNWVFPTSGDFRVSVGVSSRRFDEGVESVVIPFPDAPREKVVSVGRVHT